MNYRNDESPGTLPEKWSVPLDLGFSVIPVKPGGKKPLLDEWKSYMTSAADRATVARWAANNNCNVGIITGRVSGITILDFDTPEAEAEAKRRGLPDTVTATTGRGRHYYYACPDRPVRKPAGFPRGMDIKSEGGFVVAPGSVHETGALYEWENHPEAHELANLPEWLFGPAENERQDARGEHDEDKGGVITADTLADLASALQTIPAVDRDVWIAVGEALFDLPDAAGREMWIEWSATCPEKFNRAECEQRWLTFTADRTGYRAIFSRAARDWGWVNPKRLEIERRDPAEAFGEPDEDTPPPTDDTFRIDLGPKVLHPTEFIIDGFIQTGVSVVAGAWGSGKSLNLLPLLASAAHLTPESWGFWPVIRRKVVWVTEAPEQARDVLYSLSEADGSASWDEIREWFILCRAQRREPKRLAKMLKGLVAEASYSLPNGFIVNPVVVLDTSAANLAIENESDNSLVSAAMAVLKQSLPGISIIVVGHTPKAQIKAEAADATFRGAGAWEADASATYFLVHDDDTDSRYLAIRKCRFNPAFREVEFDHESGSKIIDTPWGEPQSKTYLHGVPTKSNGEARAVAKEAAREGRREVARERVMTDRQQRALAHIAEFIEQGRLPTRSAIKAEIGGKPELAYEALERLIEDGTLEAHTVTKDELKAALGKMPKGPLPDVVFPAGQDFAGFLARLIEREQ